MIFDAIQEWFQELLIDGIISNLTGMFDTLNTKVGEIAGEVGMTPSAWKGTKQYRKELWTFKKRECRNE